MHIRLDPPELGALQVSVQMKDGVMTATFQTSNDDATKLLSHSLGQLKHALETQGVSVDKLHVTQGPRDEKGADEESGQQKQGSSDNPSARRNNSAAKSFSACGADSPTEAIRWIWSREELNHRIIESLKEPSYFNDSMIR